MDRLEIKHLQVQTHIGLYPWEQAILQPLWIDVSIPVDFKSCQDDITKTVDYSKLCQFITTYVESNRFQLIETMAETLAEK